VTPADIGAPGAPRPGFTPRALVIDLDGTTISKGAFLHPRTQAAVRAAAARHPVIVATGRMYVSALPWVRQLQVTEPLVCYEGAVVRTLLTSGDGLGDVLLERPLRSAPAVRALHVARLNDWHFHVYEDEVLLAERERPELHMYTAVAGVDYRIVPDLEPVLARGTPKAVCVIEDAGEVHRCMEAMRAELSGTARVTQSREQYVEIVDPDANKASACELVCRRLGVTLADAVAIGDAPNDVELLDAAGFAIVVASGRHPDVLAHADATCAPPTEGGVADVIDALRLQ
jgi:Cof subfamily protein (haloacid dehalogenase superfamily)